MDAIGETRGGNMVLSLLHKWLANGTHGGLFGYLANRNWNKTEIELARERTGAQVELEQTREATTQQIIGHLPAGAVFREGTASGWREIQMPPVAHSALFVLSETHNDPRQAACEADELSVQSPNALQQDDAQSLSEP
jgi:hypothetical protein